MLHPPAAAGQHFTGCLASGSSATVLVPSGVIVTLEAEDALEAGDEIALFTNDGACAGSATWDGDTLTVAAFGADEQQPEGYEDGEALKFRIWNQSTDEELYGEVTFAACTEEDISWCRDTGFYEKDAIYKVASLASNGVLPVELTGFHVVQDRRDVLLRWKTASETNNMGFHIEHRAGQGAFEEVGFVEGEGTTSAPQQYRFRLYDLEPGVHQFRLRQVDYDGAYAYSKEIERTIHLDEPFQLSNPYPNPFRRRARFDLEVAHTQHVTVEVYNLLGQRVAVLHDGVLGAYEERAPFTFAAGSLPSGLYLVRVQGERFTATRRVALVR